MINPNLTNLYNKVAVCCHTHILVVVLTGCSPSDFCVDFVFVTGTVATCNNNTLIKSDLSYNVSS